MVRSSNQKTLPTPATPPTPSLTNHLIHPSSPSSTHLRVLFQSPESELDTVSSVIPQCIENRQCIPLYTDYIPLYTVMYHGALCFDLFLSNTKGRHR